MGSYNNNNNNNNRQERMQQQQHDDYSSQMGYHEGPPQNVIRYEIFLYVLFIIEKLRVIMNNDFIVRYFTVSKINAF